MKKIIDGIWTLAVMKPRRMAGFWLGFERFLMLIIVAATTRDVIPFPRAPKSLKF